MKMHQMHAADDEAADQVIEQLHICGGIKRACRVLLNAMIMLAKPHR